MTFQTVRRLAAPACAAAVAAAALMTSPAAAGASQAASAGCPEVPTLNAFAPWGDFGDYFMAPGGDIEDDAATWNLSGGAVAVEGNEPFIGGPGDHRSLRLPAGGSATTAQMCVGVEHRSMRFFARGASSGAIRVEAVYDKRTDKEQSVQLATLATGDEWAPTRSVPMVVNDIAAGYGNALPVALRFSAVGSGSWQIDGVHVDPYRTG